MKLPDTFLGKTAKCPKCATVFTAGSAPTTITLSCPWCKNSLVFRDDTCLGKKTFCPKCAAQFSIGLDRTTTLIQQPPPPERAEWYYTKTGSQVGPVTWTQLRELAASGQLQPTDMIWRPGSDWVAAGFGGALSFPPARPASAPPARPAPAPPRPLPTASETTEDQGSSSVTHPAAPQQPPAPETPDPANQPTAFVSEGKSFNLVCPCCSKEGHNVIEYEKERQRSIWSYFRGKWVCPHCGQQFFLWKCKHCRNCYFTTQDSPGTLVCCGLPPARVVGRKAERRWHQWIFDPHHAWWSQRREMHDPETGDPW
jgi:hypothetical protein